MGKNRFMMKLGKILIVGWVLFCMVSLAADPAPLTMLKSTSQQMLRELDKNLGRLNDKLVYNLVNRILVPHFDLVNMSRAVVGRYWQQASGSTQRRFTREFTRYVIRTYAVALQAYDGETVKFLPIRGAIGNRVQVNSELLLKSRSPIRIQYRLLQKQGRWLIYDFSVDGISVVKNYNSQFASTLRRGGLVALVQRLQKSNER